MLKKNNRNLHVGYISDMAHELVQIARADGLDRLAYLLDMVTIEAETAGRHPMTPSTANRSRLFADASRPPGDQAHARPEHLQ
jgi:hypothetical protein